MKIIAALIIAAGLAIAGYLSTPTFQLVASSNDPAWMYRLNTRTGEVCSLNRTVYICEDNPYGTASDVGKPKRIKNRE